MESQFYFLIFQKIFFFLLKYLNEYFKYLGVAILDLMKIFFDMSLSIASEDDKTPE